MKILIIDDIRSDFDILPGMKAEGSNMLYKALEDDVPREDIVICRTYEMGRKMLQMFEWDILYLDHDLGGKMTGYDIVNFIEKTLIENNYPNIVPKEMVCVSSNPSGKKRIEDAWASIKRHEAVIIEKLSNRNGYLE